MRPTDFRQVMDSVSVLPVEDRVGSFLFYRVAVTCYQLFFSFCVVQKLDNAIRWIVIYLPWISNNMNNGTLNFFSHKSERKNLQFVLT